MKPSSLSFLCDTRLETPYRCFTSWFFVSLNNRWQGVRETTGLEGGGRACFLLLASFLLGHLGSGSPSVAAFGSSLQSFPSSLNQNYGKNTPLPETPVPAGGCCLLGDLCFVLQRIPAKLLRPWWQPVAPPLQSSESQLFQPTASPSLCSPIIRVAAVIHCYCICVTLVFPFGYFVLSCIFNQLLILHFLC